MLPWNSVMASPRLHAQHLHMARGARRQGDFFAGGQRDRAVKAGHLL
jgi:hypothetical protein